MTTRLSLRVGLIAVLFLVASWSRATAQCDTTAPALTGFSFTPSSVDTTLASRTVTCNMTLTDALSGVVSAGCRFTTSDFLHTASCSSAAPTSGTPQNGVWSCVVTLPRYAPSGIWDASVTASDAVGNDANIDPSVDGFPSMLSVTSDPDLVAPALTLFTLVPGTVNVSAASQTVTCNMTLTDAKSGVASALCFLAAPDSQQTVGCGSNTPSSGTRNSGTFSCVITVPRYADAGTWIPQAFATDLVGNSPSAPFMPAATLVVTSVPEDITAPSLTPTFDFNPKTISTGGGAKTVTCTIPVADSPAGVNSATCSFSITGFVPPFDFVNQSQSCTATAPTTGTRNSGTFQCNVTFPRYSANGLWSSDVTLDDLAGNQIDLPQALQLTIDCAAGEVQTTCRFAANKQSLTWDAVAGATQYNTYRGPMTNLTDANADHLPDGGYGTCQNARDGNLTDTTFLDTDVPAVAQGYFYLVAYRLGGVHLGLGTNSFGTARTVTSPCP